MIAVVHLTEAASDQIGRTAEMPSFDATDDVVLVRRSFAATIADGGFAELVADLDRAHPADALAVVHPEVDMVSVDHLGALLRRSQRRRDVVMIGHGLGPLAADLVVDRLMDLVADPTVRLADTEVWWRRTESTITDVVWTNQPDSRWARLGRHDRWLARLPGHGVRVLLGPHGQAAVTTGSQLLTGLPMSGADVVVGGRGEKDIARVVEQLGSSGARSVRAVASGRGSPVVAEVVISSAAQRRVP